MNYRALSRIVDGGFNDEGKLYHLVNTNDRGVLKDVFTYGLRSNYNGEVEGVWFSKGHPFYGVNHSGFLFSLPYDDRVRDACKFNKYDWDNGASVMVAHGDVPIKLLTVERGFFGKSDNGNLLMGSANDRWDGLDYNACSRWMKDIHFTLYDDLYRLIYKKGLDKRIDDLPNIDIVNFLK